MSDDPRQDDREQERPTIATQSLATMRALLEAARGVPSGTPKETTNNG